MPISVHIKRGPVDHSRVFRCAEVLRAKLNDEEHALLEVVLGSAEATEKMLGVMGQMRAEEHFGVARDEEARAQRLGRADEIVA
jgi:hypothetical protein